jgi:maltose alpha-D-glucosyltransferase/alpha-amylase
MVGNIPTWVNNAVFYQIYPQSFYDTNGDGIGDLEGIIQKLDYIKSLGCDAIWLNPCYESPFKDAGYDVTDFYKIAPRYGTNADMKRLIDNAHKVGIKVVMDLVPGHTSDEHPWFKESLKPQNNEYSNRYVWTDAVFGNTAKGRFINGYSDREGSFMVNFFYCQPALNYGYANPTEPWQTPVDHANAVATKEEMKKAMRFWLEMGADGFRVDMAPSLIKEDDDYKATIKFWNEIRDMFDKKYPEAVLVSEWSHPITAIPSGFHIDFVVHFGPPAYTSLFRKEKGCNTPPTETGNSFFRKEGMGDICEFLEIFTEYYEKTKDSGFMCLPTGNHDIPRISKGRTQKELEVAYAFLFTIPGVPFVYYGDEIGMKHLEGLISKEGGYNRTGARTPMQWDNSKNCGFSSADESELYLPIDKSYDRPTVSEQEIDQNSLLNTVRKMIQLRKSNIALQGNSEFIPLYAKKDEYPFVYMRKAEKEIFIIAVNPSDKLMNIQFDIKDIHKVQLVIGEGAEIDVQGNNANLKINSVSYGIYKCE